MDVDLKPFYWLLGSVIVANFGTIIAVWVFSIKATFKISAWVANTENAIKDTKSMSVRAHKRIDALETKI